MCGDLLFTIEFRKVIITHIFVIIKISGGRGIMALLRRTCVIIRNCLEQTMVFEQSETEIRLWAAVAISARVFS